MSPECRYILCKDIANEWKESLLLISRVPLYLMQRYCQRVEREFTLNFLSAAISYAKIVQLADTAKKTFRIVYTTLSYALLFIV